MLNGRIAGSKSIVTLDMAAMPQDMLYWPEFHNGVAAGLRIASGQAKITSTWIVYNKPDELSNSHAGLLMGLGLHGHLSSLALTKVFDYLSAGHEITSIGLLLGMSVTKRGSMDAGIAKLLSVHIPSLHPPSSTDLEVPANVQTAALLGIGLLYEGSAHRRMTELLLTEIGRPPEDHHFNRESYSLAAGLALGLVTLGRGSKAIGLADLQIEDTLYRFIVGGTKEFGESSQSKSILVLEGNQVNVDVTAPGATLALGLMFLKTNNRSMAARLSTPNTHFLLDSVRPDLLMLRVLSRSLILWDEVQPTDDWIRAQMPSVISAAIEQLSRKRNDTASSEAIKQAHINILSTNTHTQLIRVNILAGCCLSIGIRFAGSALKPAHDLLLKYVHYFQELRKRCQEEEAVMLETCLNVAALALSIVMAGTGDLSTLRALRTLRKRVGNEYSYGNYMAIHMAIGFLFLGGGLHSLGTSNIAVASLVCSLYPQFPSSSTDNRYHLQAFRHLYVLAVEERCIQVLDVDTHQPCFVQIDVVTKETNSFSETSLSLMSPCLVPEFQSIKKISINSPRYWPQTLHLDVDDPSLQALSKSKVIFVKRKTGYLTYADDPKGFQSILSRSFPKHSQFTSGEQKQKNKKEFIHSFSADPNVLAFAHHFCNDLNSTSPADENEVPGSNFATSVLYECLTHEKPEMLPIYLQLYRTQNDLKDLLTSQFLWNFKLTNAYYTYFKQQYPLLHPSFLTGLKLKLDAFFGSQGFDSEFAGLLNSYLQSSCFPQFNETNTTSRILFGCYLAYHDIPHARELSKLWSDCTRSTNTTRNALLFVFTKHMKNASASTILKLAAAAHNIVTKLPIK